MRTFTEEEVEILLNSRVCEKQKTNADRIRSMSDEELAEFMANEGGYIACCQCDFLNMMMKNVKRRQYGFAQKVMRKH